MAGYYFLKYDSDRATANMQTSVAAAKDVAAVAEKRQQLLGDELTRCKEKTAQAASCPTSNDATLQEQIVQLKGELAISVERQRLLQSKLTNAQEQVIVERKARTNITERPIDSTQTAALDTFFIKSGRIFDPPSPALCVRRARETLNARGSPLQSPGTDTVQATFRSDGVVFFCGITCGTDQSIIFCNGPSRTASDTMVRDIWKSVGPHQ